MAWSGIKAPAFIALTDMGMSPMAGQKMMGT